MNHSFFIDEGNKKLIPLLILEILRSRTDPEHPMLQREIVEAVAEYGGRADRKTVQRNLEALKRAGYPVSRFKGKTASEKRGYYIEPEFEPSELRLLIDSLLFSQHIPAFQRDELITKLQNLANDHFRDHTRYVQAVKGRERPHQDDLFYNIELIGEAIEEHRKISFEYQAYDVDKELHSKRRPDGTVRRHQVSPYQMAAKEGRYFLICNNDRFDNIANYRIDRMTDVVIEEDKPIRSFKELEGSGNRQLDLASYMDEHVFMFNSENIYAEFNIPDFLLSDIVDLLGLDISLSRLSDDSVKVCARIDRMSMELLAKHYAPHIIVEKPRDLAEELLNEARKMVVRYEESLNR